MTNSAEAKWPWSTLFAKAGQEMAFVQAFGLMSDPG